MPAPAVYVVAVVGGVAAVIAFKQFVYDPHLAPRIKAWREVRAAQQQARRRRREPVPVSTTRGIDTRRNNLSRRDEDSDDTDHLLDASVELDTLVFNEIEQWRNIPSSSTLRHRHAGSAVDEPNFPLPYPLMAPSPASPIPRVITPSSYTLGSSPELGSSSLGNHTPRSPAIPALPLINQTLSGSDADVNASIYQTPPTRAVDLSSSTSSPQIAVMSPFSDILQLSRPQSRRSDIDFMSAGQSDVDDVLSFRSGLSSPVSSSVDSLTTADDDDGEDNSIRGSEDSWADIESDHSRH